MNYLSSSFPNTSSWGSVELQVFSWKTAVTGKCADAQTLMFDVCCLARFPATTVYLRWTRERRGGGGVNPQPSPPQRWHPLSQTSLMRRRHGLNLFWWSVKPPSVSEGIHSLCGWSETAHGASHLSKHRTKREKLPSEVTNMSSNQTTKLFYCDKL